MLLDNGANMYRSRRASNTARLATRRREIDERRPKMASARGGMSVREAKERRWTKFYLDCWCLEAQMYRPVRLLSAAALPLEVVTFGGRGTWYAVREVITVSPEFPSTLGGRRSSEGDGEVDG